MSIYQDLEVFAKHIQTQPFGGILMLRADVGPVFFMHEFFDPPRNGHGAHGDRLWWPFFLEDDQVSSTVWGQWKNRQKFTPIKRPQLWPVFLIGCTILAGFHDLFCMNLLVLLSRSLSFSLLLSCVCFFDYLSSLKEQNDWTHIYLLICDLLRDSLASFKRSPLKRDNMVIRWRLLLDDADDVGWGYNQRISGKDPTLAIHDL